MAAKNKIKIPSIPKKIGRPSKYFDKNKEVIFKLAARGFTDEEIAEIIGVSRTTISNWKNKYPKFFDTLKIQKKMADEKVERSLYERSCGYEHPETKAQWVTDESGGRWETIDMIRHYPPDSTSMIFWLKNRLPDKWREKNDLNLSGDLIVKIVKFSEQEQE